MFEALQFDFMRNALAAGLLASIICGILGTLIVVNRIVFLSGGIAHAAYGGIGLSFYLGLPYLVGTLGFALTAAFVMAAVTLKARHQADTIIGVIWALGMALGIILLDITPGYNVDLMSYLFGSILTVPLTDLTVMAITCLVILVLVLFFYPDILALSYDPEFARIRGVPVGKLYFLMIAMLAVTIVMVIQVVGLILVIALLTIPASIMERHALTLGRMMIGACVLGAFFTLAGLWFSYTFNLTSGAAIIIVAAAVYFADLLYEYLRNLKPAVIDTIKR
jgi:zinc transport system permease protein